MHDLLPVCVCSSCCSMYKLGNAIHGSVGQEDNVMKYISLPGSVHVYKLQQASSIQIGSI